MKSILLKPKKVVSIAFPDPSKMHKSGVNLPWIFVKIMGIMNRKFIKAAKKANVELIGQVTGANGKLLTNASQLFAENKLVVREQTEIALNEIETNGLSRLDLGKTINF